MVVRKYAEPGDGLKNDTTVKVLPLSKPLHRHYVFFIKVLKNNDLNRVIDRNSARKDITFGNSRESPTHQG
jgi:hypothetical protein